MSRTDYAKKVYADVVAKHPEYSQKKSFAVTGAILNRKSSKKAEVEA